MKVSSKIIVLVIIILCSSYSFGQNVHTKKMPVKPKEKKEEKKNTFEIGGGIMSSVVYLSRNVNEGNDARGWTVMANYGDDRYLRVSLQFTKYFPIDIAPTWYDINATTAEFNIEKMVLFKNNKTILYPFLGLSYNTFKGYFTGFNDYLNLREKYTVNAIASTKWVGLNLGTGIEHAFGPIVIFMDYKMRVGQMEKPFGFNIMDVCYSAGVRAKLRVPTLRKLYRGVNDRYHWF